MAKSMKDQLSMLNLMTLKDLPKSTSSQVSVDGHMRPNLPDGLPTNQFGRVVAPVNHSALPETKRGRKTKDISGPPSLASLKPVGPMWLWESRLRQRLASLGSTECSLTWKGSVTPQGRPLFRLVPSMPHIVGIDSGLWPTPSSRDGKGGYQGWETVERHIGRDSSTHWSGAEWIEGGDAKSRRHEPSIRLLAHGVSARVGKLRAYGNAIVPQVAAEIMKAYLDSHG